MGKSILTDTPHHTAKAKHITAPHTASQSKKYYMYCMDEYNTAFIACIET